MNAWIFLCQLLAFVKVSALNYWTSCAPLKTNTTSPMFSRTRKNRRSWSRQTTTSRYRFTVNDPIPVRGSLGKGVTPRRLSVSNLARGKIKVPNLQRTFCSSCCPLAIMHTDSPVRCMTMSNLGNVDARPVIHGLACNFICVFRSHKARQLFDVLNDLNLPAEVILDLWRHAFS
jgi:hypothetical protein